MVFFHQDNKYRSKSHTNLSFYVNPIQFSHIIFSIFGNKLDNILSFNKMSTKTETFLKVVLGFFTAIMTIFLIILTAVALANEVGKGTDLLLEYAEQYY